MHLAGGTGKPANNTRGVVGAHDARGLGGSQSLSVDRALETYGVYPRRFQSAL